MSIRRRLLWTLLLGIGTLSCIAAGGVYLEILDEVGELFDAQLQQAAYTFPQLSILRSAAITAPGLDDDNPLAQLVVEVRNVHSGTIVYHSGTHTRLPLDIPPGWSNLTLDGHRLRAYRTDSASRSVTVAQPLAVRRTAAREIAVQLLLPLLIALPIAGLLIWFGVGRGLRPLESTANAVQRRSPLDLSPLPVSPLPRELRSLTAALNDLMRRLDRALKAQKEFIADAAHELLTPLTALQLQMQLLDRARSDGQRITAQAELRTGLTRTIHVARQLLTLARQDPIDAKPDMRVDLLVLAREAVALHMPLAQAQGITIGLVHSAPASIRGDAHGVQLLLGNLIDNAIKYTQRGGQVGVSVSDDGTGAALKVEDSGPGIPATDLVRVFDRFYRRPGQDVTGSGLGLAIAQKIAMRHGATLTVSNGGRWGGVIAVCHFPRGP